MDSRTAMMGDMLDRTSLSGELDIGCTADHILLPSAAAVEGMPLGEERLTADREDHGHPDSEHILIGFPVVPHDTEERQADWERDSD